MESTATSVAVDLSITHRQACFNWTQDKVNHCVLNLKHSEVRGNCKAEDRFSHDENSGSDVDREHSDSDVDQEHLSSGVRRNPFATKMKEEEGKGSSAYVQPHIKLENDVPCESNTSTNKPNHTLFSSNTFDYKVSYPRTPKANTPVSEFQNEQDQKCHISCEKVNVPSLVKDNRVLDSGVTHGNIISILPANLNCSGVKSSVSPENDVKLPIRMTLKLNSTEKVVHQKMLSNTTAREDLSATSEARKEIGTCDKQRDSKNCVKSVESTQEIKEEPFSGASPVSLITNSCPPQKLSLDFDQHNGILKDNDSDISDGKVESEDSSDGDTQSFINGMDDSKISLDNDEDEIANLPEPVKSEDDLPFYCEICGKGFMNKQAIKHHFIIHTDERPHTCNVCKKSYRHRSALYKHKRSHTDVLAYACDVCGKRFKHKSYLNIHAVIHTQQRPYSCNICGSTFRDRSARNKHLHAHSGVRPYSCEVCGKCFGRKGDYKSHSVIHTEQRPYKCNVCGRGFRSSSNYHRHSRTHTTDCPFKCDICEKSFNQNWKLKEHKFVHSDKLPYVCDICGDGFKYPRKYKQHMENHARERLHNQVTTSTDRLDEPAYEVMDVQPDISLLLEQ